MRVDLKLFKPERGAVHERCEATSLEEARQRYEDSGWVVLAARSRTTAVPVVRGTPRFPLLLFSQELLALLSAGLTLVESLEALQGKEADAATRQVISELAADLRNGLSLSRAMQGRPSLFPDLFRSAIEASEQTGEVAEALRRFIAYERQFEALRARVVSALVYPALLTGLGLLVVLFLLVFVVPRFSVVFAERMDEVPTVSAWIIGFGTALANDPVAFALGALALAVGGSWAWSTFEVGRHLSAWAWRAPWLGVQLRHYQLSRLYRSLGMLMRSGIPAVQAMEMAAVLMPGSQQAPMAGAIESVRHGQPMSTALRAQGLGTSVSDRMLAVGERTGRMHELLDLASDFLDEELGRTLDRVVRLVEPAMMVLIGGIVGGIVLLMYLPIFELADGFK